MVLALASALPLIAERLTADFTSEVGSLRRELHSSGFGPQICSCPQQYIDDIKSMGFKASRTHDWALINPNQRVCDYFHIFPLMHLDAKDPKNYVFGPTDYLLKRTREEVGHDIFYRLGTSIEHSGDKIHFNSLIPTDFDKVAEIFAGTVRHYNCGWADGYNWGVKYWEIWNEPDGSNNMWCLPEGDETEWIPVTAEGKAKRQKRYGMFCDFFVKCLKRLKSEFPDIKVGGPAMMGMREEFFRPLLEACRTAGVAPDFISWHHYTDNPDALSEAIKKGRALCREYGFPDSELIINEWHYFSRDYTWGKLRSADPKDIREIWSGPRSHNGIDSSCFNLVCLTRFQTSDLAQGYYYGCKNTGDWGYMDAQKQKYKVFYGLQLFGELMRDYTTLCAATGTDPEDESVVTVLAVKSADGKRRGLLVTDYRTRAKELVIDVKGVPTGAKAKARIHDYTHDAASLDVTFSDGCLTIKKPDTESAAVVVRFE